MCLRKHGVNIYIYNWIHLFNNKFILQMLKQLTFLALGATLCAASADDASKSFKDIVNSHGFEFEQHTVETADGYILNVFRIPGKLGTVATKSPPAYL